MIGEKVRGRGVGREAERLTVAKAFEEFGAHRVYGRIPAFNKPAQKAVTWQDWKHEGTMREHIRRPDGTLIDCQLWGVTRREWEQRWGVEPGSDERTGGHGPARAGRGSRGGVRASSSAARSSSRPRASPTRCSSSSATTPPRSR